MRPYSMEDVRTYLSAGSVLATDLAWAEGRAERLAAQQKNG